ncbi:MAG: hypothetical protein HYS27_04855 [Deltaproteobacteria bacterium]|nr:hypothetical protein [Deltaproteobacteria bacterium]
MSSGVVISRTKLWLYRVLALQLAITATTGLALYARPLDDRPGLYGKAVKEWLVMIHNGEWIGHVLFGNRWLSGTAVGVALAWPLLRYARRTLLRRAALTTDRPVDGDLGEPPTR